MGQRPIMPPCASTGPVPLEKKTPNIDPNEKKGYSARIGRKKEHVVLGKERGNERRKTRLLSVVNNLAPFLGKHPQKVKSWGSTNTSCKREAAKPKGALKYEKKQAAAVLKNSRGGGRL